MVTQIGKDATFDFQGDSPRLYSRPPLILEARFTGGGASFPITVIGVHLRSLGGIDDVDQGPFVREKRLAQAQFLADEVQRRQAASPDAHLVVAGDFNAFQFTDGLVDVVGLVSGLQNPDEVLFVGDNVVDPPLTNQVLSLPENERYSTVFQGNAEVLDHVLTSGSLEALVRGREFGRGNADAPPDYEASPETPLAASDHDGLVVYIEPSAAGPRFVRADANADGTVNLADGIFILNFLFGGDATPPCMEAANANGDGTVNLADGIFVLNFLFGGDAGPPPPPHPDCAAAPTPLGCDSFPGCL